MTEKCYSTDKANVYTFTNPNLNRLCICLYIKAGSLFENKDNNGISHLFEHVVFRNLKKKYSNFYELMALHGINFNAATYKELIQFEIIAPKSKFKFAAEIIYGIFDEINISTQDFIREKHRIKAEIRENDERTTADFLFNKSVWENTTAEYTTAGYCKVLDRISLKKLNEYKKEILSKNNFFFYITGNVGEDDIKKFTERVSSLKITETDICRKNLVKIPANFCKRSTNITLKNSYCHYIKIGFDVETQKYSGAVHDLLYSVLFSGDKALFYNYLSEDNPLIYSFDSCYEQYDNASNLHVRFEIDKSKIEEALELAVNTFNAVKHGNFNFEANLKFEENISLTMLDEPSKLNWNMAYYNHILKSDKIDYSCDHYGRFGGVTKEQIIKAAKEILTTDNLTVAIRGEKRKINTERIAKILNLLK